MFFSPPKANKESSDSTAPLNTSVSSSHSSSNPSSTTNSSTPRHFSSLMFMVGPNDSQNVASQTHLQPQTNVNDRDINEILEIFPNLSRAEISDLLTRFNGNKDNVIRYIVDNNGAVSSQQGANIQGVGQNNRPQSSIGSSTSQVACGKCRFNMTVQRPDNLSPNAELRCVCPSCGTTNILPALDSTPRIQPSIQQHISDRDINEISELFPMLTRIQITEVMITFNGNKEHAIRYLLDNNGIAPSSIQGVGLSHPPPPATGSSSSVSSSVSCGKCRFNMTVQRPHNLPPNAELRCVCPGCGTTNVLPSVVSSPPVSSQMACGSCTFLMTVQRPSNIKDSAQLKCVCPMCGTTNLIPRNA